MTTAENKSELEHLTEALVKLAETHAKVSDAVLEMAQTQVQVNEMLFTIYYRLEMIAMATGTNLTGRFAYRN